MKNNKNICTVKALEKWVLTACLEGCIMFKKVNEEKLELASEF